MTASIIDLLKQDHKRIKALFTEIGSTDDIEEGSLAFDKLQKLLIAHSAAESEVFYPAVETDETEVLVEKAYEAHAEVDSLLSELQSINFDAPEFKQKLSQLKMGLLAHVEEEESKLFPYLRSELDPVDLADMAAETQVVKDEVMDEFSAEKY